MPAAKRRRVRRETVYRRVPRDTRSRRVIRDSVGNIYRNCKQWGTCPPDVINKVEQKTPADNILKYGSSAVFFGGLGIGTGRGSGGAGGYIPLGSGGGVRVGSWPWVPRYTGPTVESIGPATIPDVTGSGWPWLPTYPTEAAGAGETIELETILPTNTTVDETPVVAPDAPAVVDELTNYPQQPTVIDSTQPTTGGGRVIDVVAEVHHPVDFLPEHTLESGPSVGSEPAVLDVGEEIPMFPRSRIHDHLEPSILHGTTSRGTSADVGGRFSIIDSSVAETFIGEEPYSTTPVRYDPEEPLQFRTSTPETSRGPVARLKALYNRFVQQIPVEDPLFVEAPGGFVEYDNPAYDPDATIEFNTEDALEATVAPDTRLSDLRVLHRPLLSETPTGHVRVSRLGNFATMRLRSGAIPGPRAHVYHDLSSIGESFELTPFGSGRVSASTPVVLDTPVDVVVDTPVDVLTEDTTGLEDGLEDVPLLDHGSGEVQRVGVGRGGSTNRSFVSMELPSTGRSDGFGTTISDIDSDAYVHYPTDSTEPVAPSFGPGIPVEPAGPSIDVGDVGIDYFLDPYLFRKRRKRKRFFSFADDHVDS
ncbi:L2 [Eidolon helvum papillomavirus 2]|uniref:Minor capsid protein L2 n=1 Tax=Eidolon helvum papillomavirus 2 TaxID=1335476 RepID=A0A1P8YVU1_9PAPI|nr:L2 [Eidolon helvum papillomavirus 2]AQA28219.1 L2 [Eidolon helvum papillomavirus 2]